MAQFNSYHDTLDLTAATDLCREKGTSCLYKKESGLSSRERLPAMPAL